jgi:predicted metalloprotease with PDZ domain
MNRQRRHFVVILILAVASFSGAFLQADPAETAVSFTIAMPDPAAHLFHVTLRADGLSGELLDLKMPAWMPGFYRIMDYQRFVSNFRAADGAGRPLAWEKTSRNAWRIVAGGAPKVVVDYDVFGNTSFAANNFLNPERAFIAPPGMFLYPDGRLKTPVTVTLELPPGWTQVGTGLDPVPGRAAAFSASDFDTLYDCPILLGTQEVLKFEVKGVPHTIVLENVADTVDRNRIAADLKRMVEASTGMMGDIPYKHYTFLLIGLGNGGIEHANSAAIFFNGKRLADEKGYPGWLSYVAHEYFHNFNVKRIRPLALGPFDYDMENLTDMLWVSEGLTVYYEDIVLVRGGLLTSEAYLSKLAAAISRFENGLGHHFQSAAESSLYTWGTSGVGGDRNTTISYYDNGSMLGMMLDLAIRNGSGNTKSLDDVMRSLYRTYDRGKKRGFTDAEFREECERAAGGSLAEVFEYASTTKDVDYAKYLAYAGLKIAGTPKNAPGGYLGLNTRTADGTMTVTGVTPGSPAEGAGLAAGDRILEVDGAKAAAKVLSDALLSKKPGDRLKIKYARGETTSEADIGLWRNVDMDYAITPVPDPSALQAAIFKDWMGKAI